MMKQEKYMSTAEKMALIQGAKSETLLCMFESYARRNPIISEELELIRAELLIRLAKKEENI